jgi:hypothetical protein
MKLGSNITPIKEISTLVITEYAFRMQRIEDLLALVDVRANQRISNFALEIYNR